MAQVEKRIEIYDQTGLIDVQTVMVEEEPIEDMISQKEQELVRIYNEIQALKERQ
jgi:hypothetical protein